MAEAASDGAEALEILRAGQRYSAILMDCQMPIMDGIEATRVICESGLSDAPIIGLTAYAMLGDRERCLAAGMVDYTSKPVQLDTLRLILDRHAPRHGTANADR